MANALTGLGLCFISPTMHKEFPIVILYIESVIIYGLYFCIYEKIDYYYSFSLLYIILKPCVLFFVTCTAAYRTFFRFFLYKLIHIFTPRTVLCRLYAFLSEIFFNIKESAIKYSLFSVSDLSVEREYCFTIFFVMSAFLNNFQSVNCQ